MAHGSNPQLVITTIWNFNTDTVRDVTLRIVDACELNVPVGEEKRGVGAEAGVENPPIQVDSELIRTRAPASRKAQVIARGRGTWPQFEQACRSHLGPDFERHKARLTEWHDNHLGSLESPGISGVMAELE